MIRNMTIEDYEKISALWHGTKGMGLRSLDDSKEGIEKFLKRNPSTSFVCEENGDIVGVIMCGHDGRRGFIYHTVVAENYRGKSIGKKLVEAACEALKKEGIHKAALLVYPDNESGNAFWRALGWEQRTDVNYYNKSLNDENY